MDDLVTDPQQIAELVDEGVVLGRMCPKCRCRSVSRDRNMCDACWLETQALKWVVKNGVAKPE